MRIRSLTYAGKLRADRMLKPFVWENLNLRFLPCSRTGTLRQFWHPLQFWYPPVLAPSNSGTPFNFGTPSISGVPGERFHRPSLDKADAVLENAFPVWLRFPLASPRARASSDVYLATGVFKNFQPGWQRIHLRLASKLVGEITSMTIKCAG